MKDLITDTGAWLHFVIALPISIALTWLAHITMSPLGASASASFIVFAQGVFWYLREASQVGWDFNLRESSHKWREALYPLAAAMLVHLAYNLAF